jgi:hypothetical protein
VTIVGSIQRAMFLIRKIPEQTEGSNLASSSGESANYRFRDPTDVKAMLQVLLAAERKSDDADIRGLS